MQLCDRDIYQALKDEEIGFVGTNEKYPFLYEKQVQPSSIDLRLGDIIVRFKDTVNEFDIKEKIVPEEHLGVEQYKDGQSIVINPGEIVYGQIYEQMWIGDKYSARVEGRSRVARLGLAVHCTGSYINPGFCGAMPLQLINCNRFPIKIYPYIGICQLVLFEISDEPLVKYSDRSRIYNPYFDEKYASPSVLQPPIFDRMDNQSIAEYRMSQLVRDHYKGLQKGEKVTARKQRNQEKYIQQIVGYNYHSDYPKTDEKSGRDLHITINQNDIRQEEVVHMRDMYSATQVGSQGPTSDSNVTIIQEYNEIPVDFNQLLNELDLLKKYLKADESGDEDVDIMLGDVSRASKAIRENDQKSALNILKSAGNKLYDIAKSIGCSLIASIIKKQLGI